jgi:negative regulator of flagellin synthesis FlgM
MPNKISGYSPTDAPTLAGAGSGQAADKASLAAANAAATAPVAAKAASDTATITGPARTLQKLSDVIASTPVVNAEKVSAIKEAVQSGTYRVNVDSVANKLLQSDSELK